MKLTDLRFSPPGGWKFYEERTGLWLMGCAFEQVVGKVYQHRVNMKFPIVNPPFETLAQEVEAWICDHLRDVDRPRFCEERKKIEVFQPGFMMSSLLKQITGRHAVTCGRCLNRMGQMNTWGWWGCWRHREEIIGWILQEAGGRGHRVSREHVGSLLIAAFREVARRRKEIA